MSKLMLALLGLGVAAAAPAQESAPAEEAAPPSAAEALIANCDAHKFETTIQTTSADGKPRQSKVKLCGNDGQSDADWLATLKDALAKVEGNEKMASEVKTQIAAGLTSEIAVVEAKIATAAKPPVVVEPVAAAPVPATPPPPVAKAPVAKTAALPPRLSLQCYTPGDIGSGGPCVSLSRDTMLTFRADAPLAAGAALRFTYKGEVQGEAVLPAMSKGGTRRIRLPRTVCSGGGSSRIAVEIAAPGGSAADVKGPFTLRC